MFLLKLVVDASVLFSTVISKGKELHSRILDLFFDDRIKLFAPAHLFSEFDEHRERILEESGFSMLEFSSFINVLSLRIKIVPETGFERFLERARKLAVDPEDVPYLAAGLSLNCPVWSDDSHFKKQPEVKVYSTRELSKLFFTEF